MAERLRIIVLGYVVRGPLGGMAWHHLQYVQGLARLGHDVWFVEDSDDYPCCYDPERQVTDGDPSFGLRFAARELERIGLRDRWAYWDQHTGRWLGPHGAQMADTCRAADVVVNLCGVNPLREWTQVAPVRILVDGDPVFTQVRNLTDAWARERTRRHNAFFTYGENFGRSGCLMPDDGFPWKPIRQPVVVEALAVSPPRPDGAFSTVMQWRSYAAREWAGVTYGQKSETFPEFLELPGRSGAPLLLAAAGVAEQRESLLARGWRLTDAAAATRDVPTYEAFLRGSKAEWSVAKQGYVVARSGWFSERSCAYLAMGRPVVVQDTGLAGLFPLGEGVLTFGDCDEAVAALREVNQRYAFHCHRARSWVEEHFDASRILSSMLERGASAAGSA
ncbi:MAG: hypothetical protein IAE82_15565 [Opitutaceae bacterium]|nr:hypothetical protein [Opitutaceae bacterium]